MRGNEEVIRELNAALSSELTAIVQYMVQAEMANNWGYERLGHITQRRAIEEMRHAEHLIERLLFLDSIPAVEVGLKPVIGPTVKAHLQDALKDESEAVVQYNNSVAICRVQGDTGSRELFEHMIGDEERHADFLEAQLHAIEETGYQNFLAEQLKKDE
jgi:bacterioferritin